MGGWGGTGEGGAQDPSHPGVVGDRVDLGGDLGGGAAGFATGQGLGQVVELADGFGEGLVEPGRLGGVQGG